MDKLAVCFAPRRQRHLFSALVRGPDLLLAVGGRRYHEIAELGLDNEPGKPQQMPHLRAEGPAYRQLQHLFLGDRAVGREGAVAPQLAADLVDVIECVRLQNCLDWPTGIAIGSPYPIDRRAGAGEEK